MSQFSARALGRILALAVLVATAAAPAAHAQSAPPAGSCEAAPPCPKPSPPGSVQVTDVTSTSAKLSWTRASTDGFQPDAPFVYVIQLGDAQYATGDASYPLTGLDPATTYTGAIRTAYTPSEGPSDTVPFTFRTLPDPAGPVGRTHAVAGKATLLTLVRGEVHIKGQFTDFKITEAGAITSNLTIEPASSRLLSFGIVPVAAKIAFTTSGKTTGTLVGDRITLRSLVRIRVAEAKLFGAIPIAGGNSCQTKQLTDLRLAGTFSTRGGGTVTGTFSISDLNGCGVLGGLVSPTVSGGGNAIGLTIAPAAN